MNPKIQSNELWAEIKYVLDNFAQPLTDLFQMALKTAGEQAANKEWVGMTSSIFSHYIQ